MSTPVGGLAEGRRRLDTVYDHLSNPYVLLVLTVGPALTLFVFINILPIAWAIYAGFFEIPLFSPEWTWTGLGNYVEVFEKSTFWVALYRSIVFAGGSVVLQLVVGTAVALLINEHFTFKSAVRAIVLVPYTIPTAVLAFLTLWMLNSQYGIVNQLLVQTGLIAQYTPWFASEGLAMLVLILVNSWKFSIFVTLMVLAKLQSIPDDLYEAADVIGANAYQKFRDITLPNLKGVIFIVLLLRGVWMFNKFDIIWILTKGGPGNSTETAAIFAYKTAMIDNQLGQGAAISVVLFVILAVVAIIYFIVLKPSEEVRVE